MKRFVEISLMENTELAKTEQDSIDNILNLVNKTLRKSNLKSASEAWRDFIELKQNKDECMRDYVLRFENTESELRNARLPIPSSALAIKIFLKSNLTSMSKKNVLSKVDMDNVTELHTNVKKMLRDLRSLSETQQVETENISKPDRDIPSKVEVKQEPSRSIESDQHKKYSRRYQESSRRLEDEERREESSRRHEGKDRRRFSQRKENENRQNYSRRQNMDMKLNRRPIPEGWKTSQQSKKVFNISYRVSEDKVEQAEYTKPFESKEELKEHMNILVYQEGNVDVDPYHAVVDTGCPKTVCGKTFMDTFIASKDKNFIVKRKYENQSFKFGDGSIYNSSLSHAIDIEIGDCKTTLETSVVDVNIPLLLGMDYLKKWGVVIGTGKDKIHIRESKESFNINPSKSYHWKLPIQNGRTLHKQAH